MSVTPKRSGFTNARLAFFNLVLAGALAISCTSAHAEEARPGWILSAHTFPTYLKPSGAGAIGIRVLNVGAAQSEGTVTVTDTLPPGVTATEAGSFQSIYAAGPDEAEPGFQFKKWDCAGNGPGESVAGATVVTCVNDPTALPHIAGGGGTPTESGREPAVPELAIAVRAPAAEGVTSEPNRVTIAGGGAVSSASTHDPVVVSSAEPSFGFSDADAWFTNEDGTIDTQAGSHPYEAAFSFDLNNYFGENAETGHAAGGEMRNLEFNLPPGLIGDPNAVPKCTTQQFNANSCPAASQVGAISVEALGAGVGGTGVVNGGAPVYNIIPPRGAPAEFGFLLSGINTLIVSHVRSGGDYGLTSTVNNIVQRNVLSSILTLWGEPGNASHALWHDGGAVSIGEKPFFTLPTSCEGPQSFSLHVNAWENPAIQADTGFVSHNANDEPVGFQGCEDLGFGPAITTAPDTSNADTPAGLTAEVTPPTDGLLDVGGLSTADIKNTTVTLPEGVAVNPGQAAGLVACQETEASLKASNEAPSCPSASKVGTDEIQTPLLAKPLQGNVYILQSNPPNLQLLVVASGEGVNLKLVGQVRLDETTGRLTTTFANTPSLPFTNFKLSFSGGAQAALATPTLCGTYTTSSDFTPWASPFVADVFAGASFAITSGTNGAPCPDSQLPFSPSLTAGSTTDQAGGFTSFSLLLQAPDDQKRIERLQFKVPQGLLGMISQVPLCQEPQAAAGTCSSASQIGHTTVASGPGPYPLVVPQPGQPPAAIYLTGPYKGAPYGLSIVVPVHVGPFTLQTQIVRAKIEVDPLTAQITVTTDPLPQVIDGVPTDLRTVNAVIDRPGFMFNPTNCSPMSFSGTAWGTPPPGVGGPGSTAAISSPFQMGSCRSLLFKPNFKVSTSGKTSRRNGASLDAKIVYPRGPLGANQASSQSNLKSVKVDLPKQLPSRLTTLQKACTSRVFEANPANCPADSKVGTASAITPVLPVELTGPAYFVSYGGAKFPELVFILQGYGVTIQVHGETFINKEGITSSTFRQVPDVPIYQFELKLPQGPFSALAANGNLCKAKPKMPTSFTAQDGAVIKQSTAIGVTGCSKAKTKKKAASGKGKRAKKGKPGK